MQPKENYSRPSITNTDASTWTRDGILPIKLIFNSLIRLSARPISKKDGLKNRSSK